MGVYSLLACTQTKEVKMTAVIPGIYVDHANQEKCTVLGGATDEKGGDARVIIERVLSCGSTEFQHLSLEAFGSIIQSGDHQTQRFKLVQANYCQD